MRTYSPVEWHMPSVGAPLPMASTTSGKSIFEGKFHAQTYAQKAWKPNHSPAQPGCAPGMPACALTLASFAAALFLTTSTPCAQLPAAWRWATTYGTWFGKTWPHTTYAAWQSSQAASRGSMLLSSAQSTPVECTPKRITYQTASVKFQQKTSMMRVATMKVCMHMNVTMEKRTQLGWLVHVRSGTANSTSAAPCASSCAAGLSR
mmetsp:Transcript_32695/g.107871  ORF Transcript_32695/g.107871 Transcript_32695/m.107871 type:complete len:205 (-) Transcript_32695:400-1014(-)